jgi:hypothetical protein
VNRSAFHTFRNEQSKEAGCPIHRAASCAMNGLRSAEGRSEGAAATTESLSSIPPKLPRIHKAQTHINPARTPTEIQVLQSQSEKSQQLHTSTLKTANPSASRGDSHGVPVVSNPLFEEPRHFVPAVTAACFLPVSIAFCLSVRRDLLPTLRRWRPPSRMFHRCRDRHSRLDTNSATPN